MKNIFTVLLTFLYLTVSFADQTGTDTLTIGKKNSNNKKLQFNKSGTPAEIRWNNSTSKIQFSNDGSIFTDIGSGGSFGVNFLSANPDAETNVTTGWSAIQDTAQATPACSASPSAGTNSIATRAASGFSGTYANSTTAVLRGTYSFEYNKATATQIGEALTYAFTIAEADKSKPHQIVFDVDTSTAYAASDMGVYICEGTTLITPSIVNIPAGKSKFIANFNATTGTSYKLVLHVQTASASIYNLKLDNFQVGPQQLAVGPAMSDWQSYTPGTPNNITLGNGNLSAVYKRIGDQITVKFRLLWGSTTSVSSSVSFNPVLPSGLTVDFSKLNLNNYNAAGTVTFVDVSTDIAYQGSIRQDVANLFVFVADPAVGAWYSGTIPFTFAAGDIVAAEFTVPISQWAGSSNTVNGPNLEYCSNVNTGGSAGTSYTSSTDYRNGPEGALIASINSTTTTGESKTSYRCGFQYPIQPTDKLSLEIAPIANEWQDPSQRLPASTVKTVSYGIILAPVSGSNTLVDIAFGNGGYSAANATAYGDAGAAWSGLNASGWRWRVKKESGVAATALSEATSTSSGFVSPSTQTFGGSKTFADTTTGTVISKFGTGTQAADASNQGIVTTGTQTIAGAKTLTGALTAASFKTNTASVSCPHNTFTTVFTLASIDAVYLIGLDINAGDAANYSQFMIVSAGSGTNSIAHFISPPTGFMTAQKSGQNIQLRQTSSVTQTCRASWILLPL